MHTTSLPLPLPEFVAALAGLLIVVNAIRRGFLREGSLLVGLALALWLARQVYQPVELVLLRERGGLWSVGLYAVLTLTLLVAIAGLSSLAAPLVRRGPLLGLDRAAGAVVGVAEAALLLGLLALGGERMGLLRATPGGPLARTAELVSVSLGRLVLVVPPEVLASVQPR